MIRIYTKILTIVASTAGASTFHLVARPYPLPPATRTLLRPHLSSCYYCQTVVRLKKASRGHVSTGAQNIGKNTPVLDDLMALTKQVRVQGTLSSTIQIMVCTRHFFVWTFPSSVCGRSQRKDLSIALVTGFRPLMISP